MTLPHGVTWRRVHPISPLLEGWKAITAVLAILTVQNLDDLIRAVHYAKEHGFSPTGGTLSAISYAQCKTHFFRLLPRFTQNS